MGLVKNLTLQWGIENISLLLLDLLSGFHMVHNTTLQRYPESEVDKSRAVLRCFQSFLRECSQKVAVGHAESFPWELTGGVPQGSLLSPTLFI